MKKLIPFLVLLVGTVSTLAQVPDGKIDFANQRVYATVADRLVYGVDGSRLVGTNFIAQLWYGTDEASLRAHPTTATFRPGTPSQPGTWIGGTRTLTGVPYSTATTPSFVQVQVRAWDSATGSSYDTATVRGESLSWRWQVPQSTAPTASFYMEDLRSFMLIPEPSVIGLGVLGIGALFLLRRRKA